MLKGWSYVQVWQIKIGILLLQKYLPRSKGSQPPQQAPKPRVPVLEREVPIASGCKNQQGLWLRETEGCWSPRQFILKVLHMDLLRLTSSELQHWDSSLKGTRDIQGGNELSGIRVRAEGRGSFLPDKCDGRGHCSFDECSPQRASKWVLHLSLYQAISYSCPALVIP